jgi:hypothetical protein
MPACRTGYTCIAGACVSACNPPCAGNETCGGNGECSAKRRFGGSNGPMFFANEPIVVPQREVGVHQHDGLLVRLTVGGGAGTATQKGPATVGTGTSKTEFSGFAGTFSLDVGTTPWDNLVLLLRASDIALRDANIKLDGNELAGDRHSWIGAGLFGAGASYYLMPANVYFTGALGVSWVRVRDPSDLEAHTTGTGAGINIDIGKEWWIDTQWGIGIAGRMWYSRLSDKTAGTHVEYELAGGTLLFSATYQ